MFGLSAYEFTMVGSLVIGAVFWCGATYQQLRHGVKELKWFKIRQVKLEGRVHRIEDHLGLDDKTTAKPQLKIFP